MPTEPRVLLRNSERSAYKTCRFRWALTYGGVLELDGKPLGPLRSREPAKALWFGDLVHRALAPYYRPGVRRGPLPVKTFKQLYDADDRVGAVLRNDEGEWESMRELGVGMLTAYVERYRARDEEWEVISSEQTFRLPLVVPSFEWPFTLMSALTIPSFRIIVVGTFDGIWRHRIDTKRLVFREFKTAATIATDGLALDDQAGLYNTYGPRWAWRQGILPKGTYPSEIGYRFLRKAIRNPDFTWDAEGRRLNNPTKDALLAEYGRLKRPLPETPTVEWMMEDLGPPARLLGEVSKSQPAPFFHDEPVLRDRADREHLHERVLDEAREMWLIRQGVLPVYKNPGPLHSPNCRGCPVRDACELHESGADWEPMLRQTTEPWDPYSDHELAERR